MTRVRFRNEESSFLTMKDFHRHEVFEYLPHLIPFLLLLLPHLCLSSEYFVNCGSDSNLKDSTGRTFVGDVNSGSSFTLSSKRGADEDGSASPATSFLYRTARRFETPTSYEFPIDRYVTYFVRLHFFPFSDLSTALFDVSVSGFPGLLQNFSVKNASNFPLIKEFLFAINVRKFEVKFEPSREDPSSPSLAFVNAIEVFNAPDGFVPDSAQLVAAAGSNNGTYAGISSRVLQTVHRINVGGRDIEPESDTELWRKWVRDDPYLLSTATSNPSTRSVRYNEKIMILYYNSSTLYIAPRPVYTTARELNSSDQLGRNMSWGFNVSKNANHLLRVHFCDFISSSESEAPWLNLYVYSVRSQKIEEIPLEVAIFIDSVVVSDDSGFLNISVAPQVDSVKNYSFLNGLEIMEIMGELDWVSSSLGNKSKMKMSPLLIGSVVGSFALVCIVIAVVLLLRSKFRKETPAEASRWRPVTVDGERSSHNRVYEAAIHGSSVSVPVPHLNLGLKIPFAEIQSATENFSSKLVVGEGGFGKVYQGALGNGMKVAVKRSRPGHGQGLAEFHTEILVLSRIRHRHLVSLIGYCDERNEMILVYEFMQNGTLRNHLYDSDAAPCLSWKQRLQICIDAARGLQYLHTGLDGGIIHRDIKSTNILLDENLVAKVADFGLSRSGLPQQTHVSTAVKGTFGYLDPEYFRTQQLTDKSDVYSFGVVLLEVLCARPAINTSLPSDQVNLAEWVMFSQKEGLLEEVIDPFLVGNVNPSSLRKFGETAEKCLKEEGADRPSMGDVVWDLEYAFQLQRTASMQGEPLDDSTNDAASAFPLPSIQRCPSYNSLPIPNIHERRGDDSETTESEVFSQMRIDGGR